MVNRNSKYLVMLVLLAAAIIFAVNGYYNSHRQYAGQRVLVTCGGVYVPTSSLSKENGGGPCVAGPPFTLKNDYAAYYESLAVLSIVIVGESALLFKDLSNPKSRKAASISARLTINNFIEKALPAGIKVAVLIFILLFLFRPVDYSYKFGFACFTRNGVHQCESSEWLAKGRYVQGFHKNGGTPKLLYPKRVILNDIFFAVLGGLLAYEAADLYNRKSHHKSKRR